LKKLKPPQIQINKVVSELYRRSFYKFSKDAYKVIHNGNSWVDNWHIKFICDRLQKEVERIANGQDRDKHLIINIPPRTLNLN
jgi:hypothetical protein